MRGKCVNVIVAKKEAILLVKLRMVFTLTLLLLLMVVTVVSASEGYWSDLGTVDLKAGSGWNDTDIRSYKMTNSNKWDVYATAKTMVTWPSVRLVNSDGMIRSDSVQVKSKEKVYTGSDNTGTPGYIYWAQAKPAWNQLGTDSIRFQIRAR